VRREDIRAGGHARKGVAGVRRDDGRIFRLLRRRFCNTPCEAVCHRRAAMREQVGTV